MTATTQPAATAESDATVIRTSWEHGERFGELYDRHAARLHRYAYQRIGAQAAEDVVADTFLAAFQQRRSYDASRPDARPWLFGILTRKLARYHRTERAQYRALARSAAQPAGAEPAVDGPAERVAARVSAGQSRAALSAALGGLSAADRHVLLLVAWADLSYDEVATALDIPIGTVRSRLHRARGKVRRALGGTDPTTESEEDDGH